MSYLPVIDSQFRNVALSNTAVAVKVFPGTIYSWYFKNSHATNAAWVHFYNSAAVVGTTVPVWSVEIPAGGTNESYLTIPMRMTDSIYIAATTSEVHTITTAPTTAIVAFVGYS